MSRIRERIWGDMNWAELINYEFIEHYPFSVEELGLSYLDVRNLLVIMRKIIVRNVSDYSLSLDEYTKELIKKSLREYRHGGLGISLESVLKTLSGKKYRKGGIEYEMFDFIEPQPYHKVCGNILPNPVPRFCSTCKEFTITQKIESKELYEKYPHKSRQTLFCPKCKKKFPVNHLNCPSCNPKDLHSQFLSEELQKKAFIFYDDMDTLGWTPCSITFKQNFFDTILKGVELEQEVYHQLKRVIPEDQILVSTRVLTEKNKGWGVEIDILFADCMKGRVKDYEHWELWAIEVKNWEGQINPSLIKKFHTQVSPITKNLILVSNRILRYGTPAYDKAGELNVKMDSSSLYRTFES